jgi:hypothetical protein
MPVPLIGRPRDWSTACLQTKVIKTTKTPGDGAKATVFYYESLRTGFEALPRNAYFCKLLRFHCLDREGSRIE